MLLNVFSLHSQAIAQYDGKAVTITFKRPALPPGLPDPFKKLWFEHTFPVGEYEVDVSSPYPGSFRFAHEHKSAFFLEKERLQLSVLVTPPKFAAN